MCKKQMNRNMYLSACNIWEDVDSELSTVDLLHSRYIAKEREDAIMSIQGVGYKNWEEL